MQSNSLLIIGSRRFKKSTVRMLLEEAQAVFDRALFVPVNKIRIISENGINKLFYKGRELSGFNVCYPRVSSKDFFFAQAVIGALENSGAYIPVSLRGFIVSNHKYYTIKVLSDASVPIVKSSLFISPETGKQSIKEFGLPVVVKTLGGFAGKGVVLVDSEKQFESILDTVQLFQEVISAQKFVEGKNSDIRCYVIGEKVIAVRRTGKQGEWRANISRGGSAIEIEATKEMLGIAKKAARAMKLDICAIDLIETKKGLAVIEVNFMPGPFKKFLGNRIAKEIIAFLHKKATEQPITNS